MLGLIWPDLRGKSIDKVKGPAEQRPTKDTSDRMGIYDTNLTTLKSYGEDDDERRRAAPVDTSPVVDVEILETDTSLPTQAGEPSGTPNTSIIVPSSSVVATTSTAIVASQTPLTQVMLFKIRHMAQSADVHDSRVEATIPFKIERAIAATLALI
ncbi:hypothetical protein MTR67_026189 [Solanum verrucosum]|uniref:Polyprotein protein n=1 Tax=Solanum verrucosum TaxID=315347 RepID=A0AAF0QYG9_SOLVR|nr:hypothetical protein MTR67_026189 [Solanum verrucosum]